MKSYQSNKRPVLELSRTPVDVILELVSCLGLISMFIMVAYFWQDLPQTIPTHFGVSGKPDGCGGKESLLFMPVLGLFMYIILSLLSRYPHIYNYPYPITEENARAQYQLAVTLLNWLKVFVVLLFAYVEWTSIQAALKKSLGMGPWFILIVVALSSLPIIIYLIKASRAR